MALSEDDLYTAVHRMTWKRRVTGMMAGVTLGLTLGLLAGCVAAFAPWALGALAIEGAAAVALPATVGAVLTAAAPFMAIGAFTGMALGVDTGVSAGAVVAGMNVQDRLVGKDKERPSKGEAVVAARPRGAGAYFNPMVSISCALLFGAFGALLAATAATAIPVALLGMGAGTAAGMAASAISFGLLGSTIGVNAPLITAELSNAYEKLTTGKIFGASPSAPAIAAPAPGPSVGRPQPAPGLAPTAQSPSETALGSVSGQTVPEQPWVTKLPEATSNRAMASQVEKLAARTQANQQEAGAELRL